MDQSGNGVPQDYAESVKWSRKAAERGHAPAQNALAFRYASGQGVKKDYYEAVRWFRRSANQGYDEAYNNLGWHYANGFGVPLDFAEAAKWRRRAAELGHLGSLADLGNMYSAGKGVEQDYVQAYAFLLLAQEQQAPTAMEALRLLLPKLTPEQAAEAHRRAGDFKATHPDAEWLQKLE